MNGRSQQCSKSRGDCEGCANGKDEKWTAYLHAICWEANAELFLELTDACLKQIFTLSNKRSTLRGSIVKLSKSKGGIRGRYVVDLLDRTIDTDTLPEVRFPDELLKKLWGAKRA